jgi:predicted RNase H-like HicB family nuclease
MTYQFTIVITKEDRWYVAKALDLGVASQGKTIEQAEYNLKEAVELYLEDQPGVRKQLRGMATPMVTTMAVEYV